MFKNYLFDLISWNSKFSPKSLINLRENLHLERFDCFNFCSIPIQDFGYIYRGQLNIKKIISEKQILRGLKKAEILEKSDKKEDYYQKNIKNNKINFFRFALVGFLIFLFFIFNLIGIKFIKTKNNILTKSQLAYQNLIKAQDSLLQFNFAFSSQQFLSAFKNFSDAKNEINFFDNFIVSFFDNLFDNKLESANKLISAGRYLSLAGKEFAFVTNDLLNLINNIFSIKNKSISNGNSITNFDLIGYKKRLNKISYYLNKIETNLTGINETSLPGSIKEKFYLFKSKFNLFKEITDRLGKSSDFLYSFLGFDQKRTYFLVFQNNAEIRATGGFWGSYGILEFQNGKMVNLIIDDIYNPDGQLQEKIIPPRPLQRITKYWGLRDSNWFFDFPFSAKKAASFYQKVFNSNFDGIIAITPEIIEELLKITGPIELSNHNSIINSDNFFNVVQYKVEADPISLRNRKQILTDLAPLLIEKLKIDEANFLNNLENLLKIVSDGLNRKDILIYFFDNKLQNFIEENNWSGKVYNVNKDYLAIVHTNIGGWKTDKVIENNFQLNVEILEDGSIINTLEIKRNHFGGNSVYFWFNKINKDYLRIYLPLGSELLEVQKDNLKVFENLINYSEDAYKDFDIELIEKNTKKINDIDIFSESNKTVFGTWLYTEPNKSSKIIVKYKLPFKLEIDKINDLYSLLIQKQAGINTNFNLKISFPLKWKINKNYPLDLESYSDISSLKNILKLNNSLDKDKYIAVDFRF